MRMRDCPVKIRKGDGAIRFEPGRRRRSARRRPAGLLSRLSSNRRIALVLAQDDEGESVYRRIAMLLSHLLSMPCGGLPVAVATPADDLQAPSLFGVW